MLYFIWKFIIRPLLKILYNILGRYNRNGVAGTDPDEDVDFEFRYDRYNDGHWLFVMQSDYDCENIAIMSTLYHNDTNNVDYYQMCRRYSRISKALLRCECLGFIQNPLYGNPLNVRCALEELGYDVENVNPNELSDTDNAIVLIHWYTGGIKHILFQHWIGRVGHNLWCFGDGINAHQIDSAQMERFMKCRLYRICYRIKEKE